MSFIKKALLALNFLFLTELAWSIDTKSWYRPMKAFHIGGPLYYVGSYGLAVYLVKTREGLALLGGLMPGSEKLVLDSIKSLGFKPEDIRYLLINHAHFDHVGSTAALQKITKAKVISMKADVDLLHSGGKSGYLFPPDKIMHFDPIKVDKIINDGEHIKIGELEFLAHWTPGHTPGCTTWETTIPEKKKFYKLVFLDCMGVMPGTNLIKNPSYSGIDKDYARSFRILESLTPDIFLHYHIDFFDMDEKRKRVEKEGLKAWINSQSYKNLVLEKKKHFESLVRYELEKP